MNVFVWSVQHTGTWLAIRLLMDYKFSSFIQARNLFTALLNPGSFVLRHVLGQQDDMLETLNDGHVVIHDHMRRAGLEPDPVQLMAAYSLPTVIPLRDPLCSLITRRQRDPGASVSHLQDWVALIQSLCVLRERVLVLPIDVLSPIQIIKALDCYLGPFVSRTQEAKDFVTRWPVLNSSSNYEEKKLYEQGRFDLLRYRLEDDWTSLIECENALRPVLEQYGYQNLGWWS